MISSLSQNTQVALMLTAPLVAGRGETNTDLLTPGEFNRLSARLRETRNTPGDLLGPEDNQLGGKYADIIDEARVARLLGRGFLLSQAVERWQARTIWVLAREDDRYPSRLKDRLAQNAPAVLYGCGDATILEAGGLAVVGSRDVNDELVEYTENVGRRAAQAQRPVISGGARGIDQAAMRGALQEDGRVVGVLADSLERVALTRENRDVLMDGRLVLISAFDPSAGFNVGQAMQRNKYIYALSDAALVVSSDYGKGGTWSGAIEQLDKLKLVPVYVRHCEDNGKGIEALVQKGALKWPDPVTAEEFEKMLSAQANQGMDIPEQFELFLGDDEKKSVPQTPFPAKRPRKSRKTGH